MSRPTRVLVAVTAAMLGQVVLAGCSGVADGAEPEIRTFDWADSELTIAKDAGDLDVRFGDTSSIEVTRWFTGDAGDATWELSNDTLRLTTDCAGPFNSCSVRYEVLLPREAALTISGENGAISVEEPTADLMMTSTSGALHATGVASARVEARSENGSVDLRFVETPDELAVTTDNGAVTVTVPEAGYRVTTSTESGEVRSDLPEDHTSARSVSVHTENGAITLRTGS